MTCHVFSIEIADLFGLAQHDLEQILALLQVAPDQLACGAYRLLDAARLPGVELLARGHDAVDPVGDRGLQQVALGREVFVQRARSRSEAGCPLDIGDRRRRIALRGE